MTSTTEKIKHIKIDCLYGKKKHFNAADRKETYHYWIGIPLTLLNILTVSSLFFVLTDGASNWVKFIPLYLAFLASFLSGIQTYFNFNKQVESHRSIANRYLELFKKADRLLGYINDKLIPSDEVIKRFEAIASDADEINKEAEQCPTSTGDYNKAKSGIESGEEVFTKIELEL